MRAFVALYDATSRFERTVALDLRDAEALALSGDRPCDLRIKGQRYSIVGKPGPGSFLAKRKEA